MRLLQVLEFVALMEGTCYVLYSVSPVVIKVPVLDHLDHFDLPKRIVGGVIDRVVHP